MKTVSIRNVAIQFDTNNDNELNLQLIQKYLDSINDYLKDLGIQPQIFHEHIDMTDVTIIPIEDM